MSFHLSLFTAKLHSCPTVNRLQMWQQLPNDERRAAHTLEPPCSCHCSSHRPRLSPGATMLRSAGFLAQPGHLSARPRPPTLAPVAPAAAGVQQHSSQSSSSPSSELELLLAARRLSRTRLAAAVQRERQQAAQERTALQLRLDQARGELDQAQREMAALRAALKEAEGAVGRAQQERAALLKELKLERAERAGAAEHAALAERRCQVRVRGRRSEEEPAGIPGAGGGGQGVHRKRPLSVDGRTVSNVQALAVVMHRSPAAQELEARQAWPSGGCTAA